MDERIKILADTIESHPAEADQKKEEAKELIRDATGFVLIALKNEGIHTMMVKGPGLGSDELIARSLEAVLELIVIAKRGGDDGGKENAADA